LSQSKKKDIILLVGFPSNGLIGTFTISYIVQTLKMKQIGEIEMPELPPALFIDDGEIFGPIRIYKKENLFVVISDIPFPIDLAYIFAKSVIQVVKKHKIDKTIIISGLETMDIENKNPKVHGLVTHKSLEVLLYENNIPKFLSGSIFGTDAAVISALRMSNIPTVMLYAECHPLFPDPKASIHAITVISKILKIQIDVKDIKKKLEFLRIQHRKLMQQTIDALKQDQRAEPRKTMPQIYK
jgi:uncharacterized protein